MSDSIHFFVMFYFECFYVRPSYFLQFFKVRRHAIGCINNDIAVGLCSELFMMTSNYIHIYIGYGKKLHHTWGSNRSPSDYEPSFIPLDQSIN